jgi:hypothetical protein
LFAARPAFLIRYGLRKVQRWYRDDGCLRALADLDDDRLSDLSELGQERRRMMLSRRQEKFRATNATRPSAHVREPDIVGTSNAPVAPQEAVL